MFITHNFYVRFAFVGDLSRDNFVWSMLAGFNPLSVIAALI